MADEKLEELFGPDNKVRKRKKKRNIFQRFWKSRAGEYFFLKLPVGAILGAVIGYGYYKFLFDGAFQDNERFLDFLVFTILISLSTFACAISLQCRCIGVLCVPSMVGKTGRNVLKAMLTALILAGPVANIVINLEISINSMTCVAQIHSRQMKEMFAMLHAPITKGLKQIADDTAFVNDSELILKLNLKMMKANLWSKPRSARDLKKQVIDANHMIRHRWKKRRFFHNLPKSNDSLTDHLEKFSHYSRSKKHQNQPKKRNAVYAAIQLALAAQKKREKMKPVTPPPSPISDEDNLPNTELEAYLQKMKGVDFVEPDNPAKKLNQDAIDRCYKLFEAAVEQCKQYLRMKERACKSRVKIPIIKNVVCAIFKIKFLCNIIQWFDSWCGEVPQVNETSANRLYNSLGETDKILENEFKTTMLWKLPVQEEEEPVILTIDEVTVGIQDDLTLKAQYFDFVVSLIQKIVAISFIFVVNAAKKYNTEFLTDYRFDNIYINSYFKRKDRERMLQGKRCLLPLTRIEKRNVIDSRSLKLTAAERKSTLFRVIKITGEAIFTLVIFFFDYVVYYVLDLVRRHARMEMSIEGRHVLEVHVEGEGMVAQLLRRLFFTFEDNEHLVNTTISNLDCLPQPTRTTRATIVKVVTYFAAFYVLIFLEAYALRLRHVIAGIAYRRREKKRIIFLYSDLMRRRKNHLQIVYLTVRKLARNYHLKQRYSFMQAFVLSYPRCGFCCRLFGFGAKQCIICKDYEKRKKKHVTCRNEKCRITFCSLCWKELGKKCWACGDENKPPHHSYVNDDLTGDENEGLLTDDDDDEVYDRNWKNNET